jgi:hypothetical protein
MYLSLNFKLPAALRYGNTDAIAAVTKVFRLRNKIAT